MDPLLVSNMALWFVVCILSLLVFALMRQIGILHERVFPAGALMPSQGLKTGEQTSPVAAQSLSGKTISIGGPSSDQAIVFLLFVSPNCPICKTLFPYARQTVEKETHSARLYYVSDLGSESEQEAHQQLVKKYHIAPDDYLISRELGLTYSVEKLPFAVLIDEQGILRAKGMVNSREHLESLFEAREQGVASLQQYLSKS
jgi:methylamine dehydrogenase accessory protein MauD